MSSPDTCPRCGGGIPNDQDRGKYPGALSRFDNRTQVCSACGVKEAIWQYSQSDPLPPLNVALMIGGVA